MHACIHKIQWIHRRQGTKVPKKNFILPNKGKVQSELFHNYLSEAGCFFTESSKVHNTQHMRLVAIGYEYAMLL